MARKSISGGGGGAVLLSVWLGTVACAGGAPDGVLESGARNLRCPRSELQTTLNRQTGSVREYLVGCDFMYARVHCTSKGCYPAKAKPPCLEGMPCFEEDPETLEWTLDARFAHAAR